jgi:hypothetical protein
VGHASVSAPERPTGSAALMHVVAAVCAAALPLLMLLPYVADEKAWRFERVDIVVLVFSVIAVVLLLASLFVGHRRSLCLAAAALLFANFGLVLTFPLEVGGGQVDVAGYLLPLVSLIGAGAAVFAAEQAPVVGAAGALAGAGRGPDPSFTTPIGGGAGAPQGQPQQPAAAGGAQPGFYPDPYNQARLRYFDGNEWTQQTSN